MSTQYESDDAMFLALRRTAFCSSCDTPEAWRAHFEEDAAMLGFDVTRNPPHHFVEPWADYFNYETGMRWGGFLAGVALIKSMLP